MIFGLDVSTSIVGFTILDNDGNIIVNEAWDLRKIKNLFEKADYVRKKFRDIKVVPKYPDKVFIEQSLQSFRSGFSSAATLSLLSRFNGIVSWLCYRELGVEPSFIAATSARKTCGITVPRGSKAKQVVLNYVIDNVPGVSISYTRNNNPKAECYDKADSWVVARAGWVECQKEKSLEY